MRLFESPAHQHSGYECPVRAIRPGSLIRGLDGDAYSTCMWIKLYRYKLYRYLPITLTIGLILAWVVLNSPFMLAQLGV